MEITKVAVQVLKDAAVYLDQINPEIYSLQQDLLFGASIGQHTRHYIEFFQCLMDQINESPALVDYSKRLRDMVLETNPSAAQSRIDQLIARISSIHENAACTLSCSDHFEDGRTVTVHSNLERELIYNIEHTIHHLAIIKIGIAAVAPDIELPDHFGVAPSTVRYKQGVCAQ